MNTVFFFLISCALILIIELFFSCKHIVNEENEIIKISLIIIGIITAIGLILDIASFKSEYKHELDATERIVALNDGNSVEGRFYIRIGYLESNLYYNYMVDLSNGGYIANKVPARETTIFETDGKYRIEWWVKKKGYLFAVQEEKYWKAYIPKNSIVSEYEIDLK